jgi:cytochrome c553
LRRLTFTRIGKNVKRAISDTRKRGRPRVDATQIGLRLPPDQLAMLDAWIATQPAPPPSRPEAIRQLLNVSLGAVAAKVARKPRVN